MPNWCYNSFAIFPKNDSSRNGHRQMQKLWMKIRGLTSEGKNSYGGFDKSYTTKNDDGSTTVGEVDSNWMGCLLCAHGAKVDDIEDSRGWIQDITYYTGSINQRENIQIQIETAWSPKEHIIQQLLDDYGYDELNFVFTAEECGMGIYINTDASGEFYDFRYQLEYDLGALGCENEYYSTLDGLGDALSLINDDIHEKYPEFSCAYDNIAKANRRWNDMEAFVEEVTEFMEDKGEDGYMYVRLYEYS